MSDGSDGTVVQERTLGTYERWSVCRDSIGLPQLVCLVLKFDADRSLLPTNAYQQRIALLEQRFPLLRCNIADARTDHPRYVASQLPIGEHVPQRCDPLPTTEDILKRELSDLNGIRNTDDRLWRVRLHGPCLVLTVNHVICDGAGALRLMQILAADEDEFQKRTSEWPETGQLPVTLEATVNCTPSLQHKLGLVWSGLIVPKLPQVVQAYLADPVWTGASNVLPIDCPSDFCAIKVSSEIMASVKSAGKSRGIPTIHPILCTAFAFATYAIWKPSSKISIGSPRSERTASHPWTTGNYVSKTGPDVRLDDQSDFWQEVASHRDHIADPANLRHGRESMGAPSLIPGEWTDFFLEKARTQPLSSSFEVSNLGRSAAVTGAQDLIWAQSAAALGPAIQFNVVGNEAGDGGLTVSASWREGVLRKGEVVKALETFREVLARLSEASLLTDLVK